MIFNALVSHESEKEVAILMTKFAKCSPPLLVNTSKGYPESLLHIALSNSWNAGITFTTDLLKQWWGQMDQHSQSKRTSSTSS